MELDPQGPDSATQPFDASVGPAQRGAFFDHASRWTDYVAADAGTATFLVSTQDPNVGRSLFMERSRREIRALGRAMWVADRLLETHQHRNQVFVDVGANVGTATVTAVLSHGFGSAIACEPEPESWRVLRLNLALNGVDDRVRALPVAVSRDDGGLELVVNRTGTGNRWIADDSSGPGEAPASEDGTTVLRVEAVTLDQLIDRGVIDAERVGLLWLDTNGHERHVLEGGSRLLRRGVPLVLRCPPGYLDGASDGGRAASIIGEHYTHFVDLGQHLDDRSRRIRVPPAAELTRAGARHRQRPDGQVETDLLALRLSQS